MQTLPNRSLSVTKAAKPVGRRVFVSPKAVPAVAAATAPMATTVSFPAEYGLVAGAVAVSWFVHHGMMAVGVMNARKKYGVSYPDLYATAENCPNAEYRKAFNCVQRGHQNSLENQPIFLALLLAAGAKHPITAAAAGLIYSLGKVFYFRGYSTGDPNKRMQGGLSYLGLFTLVGICVKTGVQAVMGLLQ